MLSWAKSIACYTIAVSLLMGILPEGNHKKYVKFFIGIVLSLLLLSPVMKLFSLDLLLAENYSKNVAKLWEENLEAQEKENVEVVLEQTLDSVGYHFVDMKYEKAQEGELVKLTVWIEEKTDVFEVPVVLVKPIKSVEQIVIRGEEDTEIEETKEESGQEEILALKTIISSMCGVEEEKIELILK